MREILFKAKRKHSEEWVKGYYIGCIAGCYFLLTQDKEEVLIDIETLSQYTGLKDKNGVKIFENDIVMFEARDYGRIKEVGYVIFHEGSYCIKYISTYWGKYDEKYDIHRIGKVDKWQDMGASGEITYTYEVIGNRFDNPELLGGAK